MAEESDKGPVDVRVVALPDAFTTLVQSMSERMAAMETREQELRATISDLRERIDALEKRSTGDMLLGKGAPGTGPATATPPGAAENDTKEVDAGEFVQALGEQILAGSDDNSDFTIDNVQIEMVGGLGKSGERAQLATNAKQQAVSQNASKISFSVRRRTPTQVIK